MQPTKLRFSKKETRLHVWFFLSALISSCGALIHVYVSKASQIVLGYLTSKEGNVDRESLIRYDWIFGLKIPLLDLVSIGWDGNELIGGESNIRNRVFMNIA